MTARRVPSGSFDLDELLPAKPTVVRIRPWIIFAAVVIFAFFGLIFSRVSLDRSGFDLDDLETQIELEQARHKELRAQVARLQNPDRIAAIALDNGLVYPDERIAMEVPGIANEGINNDVRWAQLKAVLTAQP